jgi:cyclin A
LNVDPLADVQSESDEVATGLFEQDRAHANDPQFCVEYVDEIFEHLLATEDKLRPTASYMDTVQHDINPTMRGILIDWLVEVAEEYKLSSENLFLSQNYVDRFLSVMPVMRGRLQLVGVTCMLIASKYEEIFAPGVEDFVYITDSTYSAQEVPPTVQVRMLNWGYHAVAPKTLDAEAPGGERRAVRCRF